MKTLRGWKWHVQGWAEQVRRSTLTAALGLGSGTVPLRLLLWLHGGLMEPLGLLGFIRTSCSLGPQGTFATSRHLCACPAPNRRSQVPGHLSNPGPF